MTTRLLQLLSWTAFSVVALGFAPLAKKMALDGGAAAVPLAISAAAVSALLVLFWLGVRGGLPALAALRRRQRGALLLVGALGSGAVPLLAVVAMTVTSASNRSLFQAAYPAATAIAARLLLGERLSAGAYALIGTVCIGLALVNVDFESGGPGIGIGFWLLLATLPMIGLADVIAKRALRDISPELVAAGRSTGGAIVLLLALPVTTAAGWASLQPVLPWMLLSGACMAGFAVGLYQVFRRTQAAIAASLIALAPVLTLLGEARLLDAGLGPLQAAGFVTVVAAVIALARRA